VAQRAPDARIVASDPAGILLATMVSRAATVGDEDRVMGVVAEPDRVPVAPASFDVVSGVACLHELDDPDLVLAAAARALRPGGYAIFLAPFDGHGILRLAYERICAEAPLWPDDPLTPRCRERPGGSERRHRRAHPARHQRSRVFRPGPEVAVLARVPGDRGPRLRLPRGALPAPQ
jgi:SAM-dependent methyltransferase